MKINNVTPNIPNNTKKNPSFNGLSSKLLELSRQGTMTGHLITLNAYVFLLGSRLYNARDNDETRETLIRDVPTITLAFFGVPVFEKFITNFISKRTKMSICNEPGGSTVSYRHLEDVYKYDKNSNPGLKGFSERLTKMGKNVSLKTMYSNLNDNIKGQISQFKNNNTQFIKQITQDKKLEQLIIDELANNSNNLLKKAKSMKTIANILSFGTTLGLIGLLIPKTNILITEKIHKNKNKENADNNVLKEKVLKEVKQA